MTKQTKTSNEVPRSVITAIVKAHDAMTGKETELRAAQLRLGKAIYDRPEGVAIATLLRIVADETGTKIAQSSATRFVCNYEVAVLHGGLSVPKAAEAIRNMTAFYAHAKGVDRANAKAFVREWTEHPERFAKAPASDRAKAEPKPDDAARITVTYATAQRLAKVAEAHGVDVDTVIRGMLDTVADTDEGRDAVAESKPVQAGRKARARVADSGSPLRG